MMRRMKKKIHSLLLILLILLLLCFPPPLIQKNDDLIAKAWCLSFVGWDAPVDSSTDSDRHGRSGVAKILDHEAHNRKKFEVSVTEKNR